MIILKRCERLKRVSRLDFEKVSLGPLYRSTYFSLELFKRRIVLYFEDLMKRGDGGSSDTKTYKR